ncbi:uncharacterized protein [Argopecten irradians]|uniref:uncharacterized protein n=1 Tax=Argopecten irradians TaxID=31199 RepID=UPI003722945B
MEITYEEDEVNEFMREEELDGREPWKEEGMPCPVAACAPLGLFRRQQRLMEHWTRIHQRLSILQECTWCRRQFSRRTRCRAHIQRDHAVQVLDSFIHRREVANNRYISPRMARPPLPPCRPVKPTPAEEPQRTLRPESAKEGGNGTESEEGQGGSSRRSLPGREEAARLRHAMRQTVFFPPRDPSALNSRDVVVGSEDVGGRVRGYRRVRGTVVRTPYEAPRFDFERYLYV